MQCRAPTSSRGWPGPGRRPRSSPSSSLCLVGMSVWEYYVARRRAAARHPRPRHDPRRPPVHLAPRQRLHLPRLARHRRAAALGAARHRHRLRLRRVPLGVAAPLPRRDATGEANSPLRRTREGVIRSNGKLRAVFRRGRYPLPKSPEGATSTSPRGRRLASRSTRYGGSSTRMCSRFAGEELGRRLE